MILNGTTTWDDKDLTSEVTILSYTAVRDTLLWPHIIAGDPDGDQLHSAGATLTVNIYRSAMVVQHILTATKDTTTQANKLVSHIPPKDLGPIAVKSGDTIVIKLQSSNANDTQVDGEVYLFDQYAAVAYSTDHYPKVDVYSVSDATPESHNAAIPSSPTAGSINDLIKQIFHSIGFR